MNVLPIEKRAQILHLLVEGNSMRATSRIADVSINTVTKLLVDAGTACMAFQDEAIRNIKSKRLVRSLNRDRKPAYFGEFGKVSQIESLHVSHFKLRFFRFPAA